MGGVDRSQLEGWLARLTIPGFKSFEDKAQAVEEIRAAGAEAVFPLLLPMLADSDPEIRCKPCTVLALLNDHRVVDVALRLLHDPHSGVRCYACKCLWKFGDSHAVDALSEVLKSDLDSQVRGYAAGALGSYGGPAVIPDLLAVMASDHEVDILGFTPSHCAAMALDDILGTDETRIRVSPTLCKMRPGMPDLDQLRRLAEERYQEWSRGYGNTGQPTSSPRPTAMPGSDGSPS